MTPNDVRSEITRLAAELLRVGLAISINTPVISREGPAVRVTWPNWHKEPALFSSTPSFSLLEYRRFLVGNHFICLMQDGGMIQISFDFQNARLVGHRMCCYPCPLLLPRDFTVSDTDELDLLLLEELQGQMDAIERRADPAEVRLRLRSPVRFDYVRDSGAHPDSHLHISGPDVRVPVISPLSIGHFVQFVIRHFYESAWADMGLAAVTRWPIAQRSRCISSDDELQLHLACRHRLRERH